MEITVISYWLCSFFTLDLIFIVVHFLKFLLFFDIFGLQFSRLLLLGIVAKQTVSNWRLPAFKSKDSFVQQSTKFLPATSCSLVTIKCGLFSSTFSNSGHVTSYWLIFVNGLWLNLKFCARINNGEIIKLRAECVRYIYLSAGSDMWSVLKNLVMWCTVNCVFENYIIFQIMRGKSHNLNLRHSM